MRGFRFGLTGRGLAMLTIGSLLAAGASVIGEPDLAWVGVFVAALPIVGLVAVLALPPRLACERSVLPESLPVGETARVNLLVASRRTISFSALSFRDQLPSQLGRDATFELIRGLGRWHQPDTTCSPSSVAISSWDLSGCVTSMPSASPGAAGRQPGAPHHCASRHAYGRWRCPGAAAPRAPAETPLPSASGTPARMTY